MLLQLVVVVSILSFVLIGFFDILKEYFEDTEKLIGQATYFDRINKEKYLEEVGCNFMNDPW